MSTSGIVVSSGVAFGQSRILHQHSSELDYQLLPLSKVKAEQLKLTKAVGQLLRLLQSGLHRLEADSDNYQLIEADMLLLEDEELSQQLLSSISEQQFTAGVAVERVFAQQANQMLAMEDPYLANRAEDVLCLGSRLIAAIHGSIEHDLENLTHPTILLATDLTPAEFATLPLDKITGIVLKTGGLTSHTAILARSAGIPALLSCDFDENMANDQQIALDALSGCLHVNPDQEVINRLERLCAEDKLRKSRLQKFKDLPTETRDKHRVPLLANVGCLSEISHLSEVGADGIGLFRTEFMLMNAEQMPDEDVQYALYCDAVQLLNGKTFTIRTFDIGADKELPCLSLPDETNPALGFRGARYSLAHVDLFKAQLKAVLRAANHGPIRLMFPMINQVEELDELFALIEECKAELVDEERGYGELNYGIVVETPSAVMNLASMLPMLDFISIGTNDLTQYAMAADRTNPDLTKSYPSLSPSILKLIKMTVDTAKDADIPVSLCGELASNPLVAPILIGMGIDELSVNVNSLLELKSTICGQNLTTYIRCSEHALSLERIEELNHYISHCY
ncbi:phosphoenolpyruvate--protein phosphotransferase [uncultured Shewanella sp.]|uniref:phosphoenolpyruvate--protein phosphotransferase n=1 Tax=Shewanella atlantica TaxID=271099 RepID=UPI00263996EA|nr:phosphoenolpyruvate--protein phosphotransferase [uncultured Shewanella sp.]